MTTPLLAPSLMALRDEINQKWPRRDQGSDGWIGDHSHSSRVSDHNPDQDGIVHAIDVDKDGLDVDQLLETVIGDRRVWYVIFNRRIYSRTHGWTARTYTGTNGHEGHIHISIRYGSEWENDTARWFEIKKRTTGGVLPTVNLVNMRAEAKKPTGRVLPGTQRVQRALIARYDARITVDGKWPPHQGCVPAPRSQRQGQECRRCPQSLHPYRTGTRTVPRRREEEGDLMGQHEANVPIVNEAVARPVRTVTQGVLAGAILELVDSTFWDMPERTYAALLVLLTAVIGAAQVSIENGIGKAFLRQLPTVETPLVDQVPDDEPDA